MTERHELLRRTLLMSAGGVGLPAVTGCLSRSRETPTETTTTGDVFVDRTFTVTTRVRVTVSLEERTRVSVRFTTETDFSIDVYTIDASELDSFIDPGEVSGHVEALSFLDARSGRSQARLEPGTWTVILDNSAEIGEAAPPAPDDPDAVVALTVATR